MDIDSHLQPSRRTIMLVYFCCLAVPFAVAGAGYLVRTMLADKAPQTALLAQPATMPLVPPPQAPKAVQASNAVGKGSTGSNAAQNLSKAVDPPAPMLTPTQ
jgi:hypothetical protein